MRAMSAVSRYAFALAALWIFACGCASPNVAASRPVDAPPAVIVGYWHNWKGKATEYIPLRDVSPLYTHIVVAFALPAAPGSAQMRFQPTKQTADELKADIRQKQARGTKVLISVGGGNHPIVLRSASDVRAFASSIAAIVKEYGFDGVDINLEGESVHLDPGDTDFRRPTTPRIVYLIEAVRQLDRLIGREKLITMAPETQYLVAGYKAYGEKAGGYLPVIHALRDILDWVQMQYYNAGTKLAYSARGPERDVVVKVGTPDFVVALAEMLILGFPVGQDAKRFFPGLGAEKVVIGLPASPASGNGYLAPKDFVRAMRYLMRGDRSYRTAYTLRQKKGHPALRGVMTWSINWDASTDGGTQPYQFARAARGIL